MSGKHIFRAQIISVIMMVTVEDDYDDGSDDDYDVIGSDVIQMRENKKE